MKSVSEQIRDRVAEASKLVRELLTQYSQMERDRITTDPDSPIAFIGFPDYHWKTLDVEGRRLQSRIRERYDRLSGLLKTILRGQPPESIQALEESITTAYQIIDHHEPMWFESNSEALNAFEEAMAAQVELISHLYDASEGEQLYVPDTNALLHNPALEDWDFDSSPRFTLILTPTVLSELDKLKINHRNEDVRKKAEGLIRRIKGYRSRGSLSEGVPLRSSRSSLRTLAVEPDMDETLPWLKADNDDDRILAGFVEVMREHPRCEVLLVTRDINLQNKAEYAGLLFVEPPDPIGTAS